MMSTTWVCIAKLLTVVITATKSLTAEARDQYFSLFKIFKKLWWRFAFPPIFRQTKMNERDGEDSSISFQNRERRKREDQDAGGKKRREGGGAEIVF